MSNLIGSSKILDNATMRARTSAAIRRIASEKGGDTGASGELARAALLNPEFVIPAFLTRISVNPAVIAGACVDCGHAAVDDGDILYVVTEAWAEVASSEFPLAEADVPEQPQEGA